MRKVWLAVPALFAISGCAGLVRNYQAAARQLRFDLERVEPSLQLSFPLEESRVGFRLIVGVDNPTQVHFRARGFTGRLALDGGTETHTIGQVTFSQGLELPPGSHSQIPVDLTFNYRELKQAWSPLTSTLRGQKGTWRLEGQLQLEAFGIPFTVPIRPSKTTGH